MLYTFYDIHPTAKSNPNDPSRSSNALFNRPQYVPSASQPIAGTDPSIGHFIPHPTQDSLLRAAAAETRRSKEIQVLLRMKDRKLNFSNGVRRVVADGSSVGRGEYGIYVETDDPEIRDILVARMKNSQAELDAPEWGLWLTNVPKGKEERDQSGE